MNKPQATGLTYPGFRYCHTVFVSTIYKYNVRAYIIFKLHNPSRKKTRCACVSHGEDKHFSWRRQTFAMAMANIRLAPVAAKLSSPLK